MDSIGWHTLLIEGLSVRVGATVDRKVEWIILIFLILVDLHYLDLADRGPHQDIVRVGDGVKVLGGAKEQAACSGICNLVGLGSDQYRILLEGGVVGVLGSI